MPNEQLEARNLHPAASAGAILSTRREDAFLQWGEDYLSSLEHSSLQPMSSTTSFQPICCAGGPEGDGLEPWRSLLHDAAPKEHIVQLYQDQQFLNRAVCRFAAAALAHGEGVILVPTAAHWEAFYPRLEAEGVDIKAAQSQGQLTVVDADELLPRFMGEKMPDAPVFLGLAGEVVARARGRNRYPKVRWWGEMVNVLWERGDATASMALEDLFDQLAHEQEIAIFCSFLMDNFDGEVHTRMLPRLGQNHSHLIPVENYFRLERAVANALREVVGPVEASVLERKLLESYAPPFAMPSSQALLFALRQVVPDVSDAVLQRSGTLYRATE
jgi:hypothetical protein